MANVKVGWGKCVIVGGGSTLTTSEINNALASNASGIILPIEGTTQLTTQEGEKSELKYEGGKVAAVRYGADTYTLEFSILTQETCKEEADRLGNYESVYVIPEDASVAADTYTLTEIQSVRSTVTGNSADGYRTNYRVEAHAIR